MKNIVSLLAVALFAGVFAAGCGGSGSKDKCGDATTKETCVDSSFVDSLKGKCKWNDTSKKCEGQAGTGGTGGTGGTSGTGGTGGSANP